MITSTVSMILKSFLSILAVYSIAMIFLCDDAYGNQPQELFNRGNFFMEQDNYHGALEVYRDIENRNYVSGPLYLNMAISYVHIDSLGLAKYYFLKASEHSATRANAQDGMAFIESQLNLRRGPLPRLTWITLTEWLHFEVNKFAGIITGIVLINLGIMLIITGWFKTSFNKTFKYSGAMLFSLGLALTISGLIIDARSNHYSRAVMVERQTEMRPHPSDDNEIVSLIFEGYTFTLNHSKSQGYEGWKFARLSNGLSGWIDEQVIREL